MGPVRDIFGIVSLHMEVPAADGSCCSGQGSAGPLRFGIIEGVDRVLVPYIALILQSAAAEARCVRKDYVSRAIPCRCCLV